MRETDTLTFRKSSLYPLYSRRLRNDASFVPHVEQQAYGFASVIAIIQGTLVDIHANEFIGLLGVEVAGELHGVSQSFFAMIDAVLNTLAQRVADAGHGVGTQ